MLLEAKMPQIEPFLELIAFVEPLWEYVFLESAVDIII